MIQTKMTPLSAVKWILFFLLCETTSARCTIKPIEGVHPVEGLLERFEAGPGCAARESGPKETHVIAVGRSSNSPENKVIVQLKPLSPGPLRAVHLLLSSRRTVLWSIEEERLPPEFTLTVQVSSQSRVESSSVRVHVQTVPSLPFRPRALHRWALRHHGNITSLTHNAHANRVYIKLGQDLNQSTVCQLQSTFLSHNYMTSDLQPQEVQGCTRAGAEAEGPEIHVIKLHSAGSGLCGSLQVEVEVSLVPLVSSRFHDVVLILSSSVPVNWALLTKGIEGRVSIHSSNSVSPPFPPEPNLTVSSRLHPDLSTVSDLLLWARGRGYRTVTSYTEADLANRFVIHLNKPGTAVSPPLLRPPWTEERRLRLWLSDSVRTRDGQSFTVTCEDGRLSVTLDQHVLQSSSVPVAAVTLRDPTCQAQSNGSHFLLVYPVISCQTEGALLGPSGGVQYKNTLFLWRDEPEKILALNETELKSKGPLSIHFTCLASALFTNDDAESGSPPSVMMPESPKPEEEIRLPAPRHRPGPVLTMRLFVSETYEERRIGPCVITAENRVYTEISAKGPLVGVIKVKSCVISPQSDPKKSPFWSLIWDGCSSDPSVTLHTERKHDKDDSTETEEENIYTQDGGESHEHRTRGETGRPREEEHSVRFSFVMRGLYNDSMQFLHCSLLLCNSELTPGGARVQETDCQSGTRIPPLVYRSSSHQCEIRNLSRPMVVTQPISSLATKLRAPPAGQRFKRLSVSPISSPDPEHTMSVIQTGPLMGIVFVAFVIGVSLMGALWYIYSHTGPYQTSLSEGLTDEIQSAHRLLNPSSLSVQLTSSV